MRRWNGSLVAVMLAMFAVVMPATTVAVVAADDPVTVVQRFVDARNRGDVVVSLMLVADDAPFIGGPGCPAASPCVGAAAHRGEVEGFAALHARVTLVAPRVSGTTVQARTEFRNDLSRAAGVDRGFANLTAEVQGGKITNWRSINDASDPLTAQYLAYLAAQPAQPTAAPAAASPPSAPPRTGGGGEAAYVHRLGDG